MDVDRVERYDCVWVYITAMSVPALLLFPQRFRGARSRMMYSYDVR